MPSAYLAPPPPAKPSPEFATFFSELNTPLLSPSPLFLSLSLSSSPPPPPPPPPAAASKLPPFPRAVIGAAAGAAAGAATYAFLLPLDAIKTRIQSTSTPLSSLSAAAAILNSHGILGFYRGLSAVVLGSASSSAIYFGTCELGKALLSLSFPSLPALFIPPLAGAMGNVSSSLIMVPKELVMQRIQSGADTGRSWQVALRIVQKDGFLGLYTGYAATLMRNLPAGVLSYSSFEYLKSFVLSKTRRGYLEPAESVVCGALAGAVSAALTTPLDVVKTRLMTRAVGAEAAGTVFGTMRKIVAEEGAAGLARGIGPRVVHSACFAALGYCAFETARLAILRQYLLSLEPRQEKVAAVGIPA